MHTIAELKKKKQMQNTKASIVFDTEDIIILQIYKLHPVSAKNEIS
jgi:hypothetical protein